MTFYADIAAAVQEVLSEFGSHGQVTRTEQGGTYNPETGDYDTTTVTQDCTAVVFPIDQKLVDGTTVLATDETAYLSAVGLETPKPTDKLLWGAKVYTIMRVENLAPAGTSVLVTLIVRR